MTPDLRTRIRSLPGYAMKSDREIDGLVRAVLEGVREPTEGMVEAGWNARGEVDTRFTAMIDALLGEG